MNGAVVFVTTELDPVVPGGAGTVVTSLAAALAAAGREVVVVLVAEVGEAHLPGVEIVVAAAERTAAENAFLERSRKAAQAVHAVAAERAVELVEFADFDGLAYWALAHRAELGLERTRVAVRFHGPAHLLLEAAKLAPPEFEPVRVMEEQSFAMADAVLVPSAPLGDLAERRYGVPSERVVVAQPPIPQVEPARYQPAAHPEVVCYGRLSEAKGSHDFLAAILPLLDSRPELLVRFVGPDGWSFAARRSMREVLQEMVPPHHRSRVLFEGALSHPQLAAVLRAAWLVVVPSRFESFCLAAHEVRAMGLPLVAADLPAFRPYFSTATGVVAYDGTVEALTGVLDDLLDSPDRLVELAAAPLPPYSDPLEPYAGALPAPRHPTSQSALATAASQRFAAAASPPPRPSLVQQTARRLLRLLPSPAARLAVRVVPQRWKDRFRAVANWRVEEARREETHRWREVRTRIRRGELSEVSEPEVTVVIPCHNQGRFLGNALLSVYEQTRKSFEIVVVDDGSDDAETIAVIERLDLLRTRVVRTANRGLPAARNTGIRAGRGEFVVPLDADDALAPTYLEEMLAALAPHPAAAYAHCYGEYFGDYAGYWITRPYNAYQLLLSNSVLGCVLLRRRAWEDVGGYDETMRNGNEDWDLWLRLLEVGWEQVQVPRPLFRYRRHGVSMSLDTEARFERGREELARRHPGLYESEKLRALKAAWYPTVSVLLSGAADIESLRQQDLDDLEVVARGDVPAADDLARERGWPIRKVGPDLGAAVRAAGGKYVVDWDRVSAAVPGALRALAGSLETAPDAMGARGSGSGPVVMWRRWTLLDPDAPHAGAVEAPAHVDTHPAPAESELRAGAYPTRGWTVPAELETSSLPVIRQRPEEEGAYPGWLPGPGEQTHSPRISS